MTASARYEKQKLSAIRAAAKVFADKGYHGASTRDIADQLGIKQGSLYYYFKSKEEALEEVCLYGLQRYVDNMTAIATEARPLAEQIFAVVTNHLTSYLEKNEALKVHNDERLYLPEERRARLKQLGSHYRERLEAIYVRAGETGELRNIDAHFAALATIGICNSFGEHIVRDPEIDVFDLARKCSDVLLHGLAEQNQH